MTTRETMTTLEAVAELTNAGAKFRIWQAPRIGGLKTIYVSDSRGEKIKEIWVRGATLDTQYVDANDVWRAIYLTVTSN